MEEEKKKNEKSAQLKEDTHIPIVTLVVAIVEAKVVVVEIQSNDDDD